MAANDGKRLTVFGLGFRDHDNRQMQQILRHYNKLPGEVNRTTLYVALTLLAKEVDDEDAERLTTWLTNGAKADEFPFEQAPPPALAPQPSRHHNPTHPGYSYHGGYGGPSRGGTGLGFRHDHNTFDANRYVPYDPRFSGHGRTIEDGGPPGPADLASDDMSVAAGPENEIWNPAWLEAGASERSFEEIRITQTAHLFELRDAVEGHTARGLDDHEVDEGEDDSDLSISISDSEDLEDEDDEGENDVDDEDEEMTGMTTSSAPENTITEMECLVCFETLPTSDFPKGRITRGCRHRSNVCFPCINSSIQEPIARGALHLIICPLCPRKLGRDDIKAYATKEVFDR